MLKLSLICVSILFFCMGCDNAAKQQQANQAQQTAVASELRQIGEDMQNAHSVDLSADDTAND